MDRAGVMENAQTAFPTAPWTAHRTRRPQRPTGIRLFSLVIGEIYEVSAPEGLSRLAPRLNGMVISVRASNGTGFEYQNFRLEDPPDHVFEPPPGAVVTDTGMDLGQFSRGKKPSGRR